MLIQIARMRGSQLAAAMLVYGLASGACGGTVVLDSTDGSGGANGSTATTNGPVTTVTTVGQVASSALASVTTGGGDTTCAQACGALADCADIPDCEARCAAVNPGCIGLHHAWLDCLVANGLTCFESGTPVDACSQLLLDYDACEMGLTMGMCAGDPMMCVCDISGSESYQSECMGICNCRIDGSWVAECDDILMNGCDPIVGCCAPFFYITGQ